MFDVGISEIAVIAVVALVVIGPERLPKVARTVGALLGRAQRYVNEVKAEVNREMELEELRKLQSQMQDAAKGIQEQVAAAGSEMQSAVHELEQKLHEGASPDAAPAQAAPAEPATFVPVSLADATDAAATAQPVTAAAGGAGTTAATGAAEPHAAPPAETATPTPAPGAGSPSQSSLFPEHTVR